MNCAENKFILTDIGTDGDKVIFKISLLADGDIRDVYLNNYFEGVYIEIGSKKYNIYTQTIDGVLVSEMCYETVAENAANSLAGNLRLYAALRIGETEILQPVEIMQKEVRVSFGHWSTYYFAPFNDFKFCFLKQPFYGSRVNYEARLDLLSITDGIVEIQTELSEKLSGGEFTLLRKDSSDKNSISYVPQKADGNRLVYRIAARELIASDFRFEGEAFFEFMLLDGEGGEHDISVENSCIFEKIHLPVSELYAVLLKKNGRLCMKIKEYLGFELCDTDNDSIVLKYPKRPYPLEIAEVIAQRVNTDIEYSLPMEISEDESSVSISLRMEFGVNEQAFKKGVYQFWAIMRDGAVTNRVMIRILRDEELSANTYLIHCHPYAVIGEHYYSCMFYCDTSNSLKCMINPKYVKAGIKCGMSGSKLRFGLNVLKEPFFDENIRLYAISESGAEIHAEKYEVVESKDDIVIDALFDPREIFSDVCSENITPLLTFGARNGIKMALRNNLKGTAVPKRELESFSDVVQINGKYINVWADFKNDAFMFGESDDLRIAVCEGVECNGREIIVAATIKPGYEELCSGALTAELENVIDKQKIGCRTAIDGTKVTIRIDFAAPEFGDYNIWLTSESGIKSSVVYGKGIQNYLFGSADKKCELRANNEALCISVQELLLFENRSKYERCMEIADRARGRFGSKAHRTWLIGENYGLSARDNGLAFFEYCMQRKSLDADVYFITKNANKDIAALEKYKDHVIIYDSDKHLELDAVAEFYIVSHGIRDVMPSLYHNQIGTYRKPVIYLQHGIMAMKIVNIDNKSYGGSIRRFIVSSQYEKRLLTKHRQFWDNELAVTGLARYDKLTVGKENEPNYIWIMPTWRDWLVSSCENFVNTEFYLSYKSLLTDAAILKTLRENKCKIVFSLHIEFEKYKPFFDELSCDVVEITDMHSVDIGQRIRECRMIVTDYSSIIFDVVYLHKPVLFFQFDKELYDVYRGSYVDMENDLPGEVLHTSGELADALISTIEHGFEIPEKFAERRKKFFDFEDRKNSERIYDTILEVREEMSDEH